MEMFWSKGVYIFNQNNRLSFACVVVFIGHRGDTLSQVFSWIF